MSVRERLLKDYPKATIVECTASSVEKDGSEGVCRLRLCFDDLHCNEEMYRVAIRTCVSVPWSPCCPFTVSVKGVNQKVWVIKNSLKKRFKVTDQEINEAKQNDDLGSLFKNVILSLQKEQRLIEEAKAKNEPVYLSRKEYPLNRGVYVTGDLVAYKVPKSCFKNGSSARIKKAELADGTPIVLRVATITKENEEKIKRTTDCFERFKDNPYVVKCLGYIVCKSSRGVRKLVSLHPPMRDLNLVNNSEFPKTEEERVRFARRLLEGLHSLKGEHGDLRLENILIRDDGQLFLHDFEYFIAEEEEIKGRAIFPYNWWCSPEMLLQNRWVKMKGDPWALGYILYYIFRNISDIFPCHARYYPKITTKQIIQQVLDAARFQGPKRTLIEGLLEMDPQKRWTVEAALRYFNEHIDPPKLPQPI